MRSNQSIRTNRGANTPDTINIYQNISCRFEPQIEMIKLLQFCFVFHQQLCLGADVLDILIQLNLAVKICSFFKSNSLSETKKKREDHWLFHRNFPRFCLFFVKNVQFFKQLIYQIVESQTYEMGFRRFSADFQILDPLRNKFKCLMNVTSSPFGPFQIYHFSL